MGAAQKTADQNQTLLIMSEKGQPSVPVSGYCSRPQSELSKCMQAVPTARSLWPEGKRIAVLEDVNRKLRGKELLHKTRVLLCV